MRHIFLAVAYLTTVVNGVLIPQLASTLEESEEAADATAPSSWDAGNPFLLKQPHLLRVSSDPRVVVSLTTVPGAVRSSLPAVLAALRNQTVQPDAIELNLPIDSRRQLGAYPDLRAGDAVGIDVYRTEDWLALTNIVPTLQRARSRAGRTLIIVVDDDKLYPPSLVEDHLRAHRAAPRAAATCRGYRMPPGGDLSLRNFFPAWDELWHSVYGHSLRAPRRVAVVAGSDSWSVPADLLGPELWTDLHLDAPATQSPSIGEVGARMNDVWVSGQLSRHRVPKFVIPCRHECRDAPRSRARQVQELAYGQPRLRQEWNQRVMQWYSSDWLPDEMMSLEEVRGLADPRADPDALVKAPEAQGGFFFALAWAARLAATAVRALHWP